MIILWVYDRPLDVCPLSASYRVPPITRRWRRAVAPTTTTLSSPPTCPCWPPRVCWASWCSSKCTPASTGEYRALSPPPHTHVPQQVQVSTVSVNTVALNEARYTTMTYGKRGEFSIFLVSYGEPSFILFRAFEASIHGLKFNRRTVQSRLQSSSLVYGFVV